VTGDQAIPEGVIADLLRSVEDVLTDDHLHALRGKLRAVTREQALRFPRRVYAHPERVTGGVWEVRVYQPGVPVGGPYTRFLVVRSVSGSVCQIDGWTAPRPTDGERDAIFRCCLGLGFTVVQWVRKADDGGGRRVVRFKLASHAGLSGRDSEGGG
jgi:hypothetical protein